MSRICDASISAEIFFISAGNSFSVQAASSSKLLLRADNVSNLLRAVDIRSLSSSSTRLKNSALKSVFKTFCLSSDFASKNFWNAPCGNIITWRNCSLLKCNRSRTYSETSRVSTGLPSTKISAKAFSSVKPPPRLLGRKYFGLRLIV